MNIPSHLADPVYEFHVAKVIRDKYELDESFFSLNGHVVFANFYQVRLFAKKLNDKREVHNHVSPGEINGAGLLDEIYHIAIKNYIRGIYPNVFKDAISTIQQKLGVNNFEGLLLEFVKVFPPKKVFKNELTPQEYVNGETDLIPNKEIILEEIILLHFSNRNPAFKNIKELFDENYLDSKKQYKNTIVTLKEFFKSDDLKIGINNSDLFDFLSMPFIKYSHSIWDQLEYIKNEWGIFIDHRLLQKIKSSKDLFTESIRFEPQFGNDVGGGAPTIVPKYKGNQIDAEHLVIGKSNYKYAEDSIKEYEEFEQFTPDVNWMPNLVLMAKNIYVWLDQLSKKYKREIKTLDQIPLEELEQLQKWNINGLWLIGVWERSPASKRIKHLMGNIDAVASAYSLYDYTIANDLGGEHAYNIFNERAKQVGIRLASDMVPNHTGICSDWMINHPDYFVQLDYPPFPNYTFTGENLSEHPHIEMRIEDQYYEMKDAAVVFERKDNRSGEKKYVYHGNDGTVMPWNDTAQLDLLKHEVREALIQKIFDVARKFSVIRFDAAMTLAKKHFSRLWYPEPGKGGDIPSRSDHALTRRQFDELFPKEFWREVVDRINTEMPETLLLAEAFWLMEGYFVRTLGMHRVYNSAFMNMMMNEENAKYRELITNTLEFEPEILKRYVNFMSNPDEETAIEQFGNGDKYFGVLVLMNTLPGLPMFAHGQIEGYTEKYGMEYQRAYYDEKPIDWLVERHEKEIFPVLRKRYIFSEVKNYWLYDFLNEHGDVNENVYVYSNKHKDERGLVVFNNSLEATSGRFHNSRQKLNGNSSSDSSLKNIDIGTNLEIKNSDFHFYILRDNTNGLEYLYNGNELSSNGMYLNLNGYEYRVFLHVEEIFDPTGNTYRFYREIFGRGVYDIKGQLREIQLSKVHSSFIDLFEAKIFDEFEKIISTKKLKEKELLVLSKTISEQFNILTESISEHKSLVKYAKNVGRNYSPDVKLFAENYHFVLGLLKKEKSKNNNAIIELLKYRECDKLLIVFLVKLIGDLGKLFDNDIDRENFIYDLILTKPVRSILKNIIDDEREVNANILLVNLLLDIDKVVFFTKEFMNEFLQFRSGKKLLKYLLSTNLELIKNLFESNEIKLFLEVNTYKDKSYYSKERLEELADIIITGMLFEYGKYLKYNVKSRQKQKTELVRFTKKLSLINSYIKKQSIDSNFLYENIKINLGIKN